MAKRLGGLLFFSIFFFLKKAKEPVSFGEISVLGVGHQCGGEGGFREDGMCVCARAYSVDE